MMLNLVSLPRVLAFPLSGDFNSEMSTHYDINLGISSYPTGVYSAPGDAALDMLPSQTCNLNEVT
eukprot:5463681-Amphidinium_carterae.1